MSEDLAACDEALLDTKNFLVVLQIIKILFYSQIFV